MKILSSQALHEVDVATCEAQNIDSNELIERTANAVCYEIISRFLPGQRFVIFAGPGNNGGDALAVARFLLDQGYKNLEIFLFNINGRLSKDCDEERKKLIMIDGIDFTEVTSDFIPPYLGKNDVLIDGLFGSGLKSPLQRGFMHLANYINNSGAYVISLDIPSGLFGESNENIILRDVVHANLTLAYQLPRLSFFFEEHSDIIGEWKLLDIELDADKIKSLPSNYWFVEARSVRPYLHKRLPFTGKRDYGSALIFAGSAGMMGAAVMCAKATMKAGAGLTTVHSARCGMQIIQIGSSESMYEPDRNELFITDMTPHHSHQAIAVGPGIGVHEQTISALESLLKNANAPLILDADALNCISQRPALLSMIPQNSIITPHIGEFDRLFGEHHTSEERLRKAIDMAKYYGIIIVLKGHYTATIRPTGRVDFNSTGNPGMATAGAGDVLTGVITAFLAQGFKPELAAVIGVYIHGLAGDLAEQEFGEAGLTAADIADYVGRAIRLVITRGTLPKSLY